MPSQITDNFETYNVADLTGQGSWTGPAGKFDVQSSVTKTGSRAIKGTAPGGTNGAFRTFTAALTGTQVIWLNHNRDSAGVDCKLVIGNTETPTTTDYTLNGSAQIWLNRVGAGDLRATIATGDNNETGSLDLPGGTALSFGTWYKLEIEWINSQGLYGQFRGRIDDGTFSDWVDTTIGIRFDASGIGFICLAQNDPNTPTQVYFDELGEPVVATGLNPRRMMTGLGM